MQHEQVSRLLEEHRADMLAVAVGMLGWCPEAEDAVQDASLTAIAKIGQLRETALADAWLRAITRNVVRMHWRRPVREIVTDPAQQVVFDRASTVMPSPEQVLEQHQLRDWIWAGIDQLTPVLQLPVMLRYFSSVTSYQEIAAACQLPVGTVRSRLSQARSQLASSLSGSTAAEPDDAVNWSRRAASEALDMLHAADAGHIRSALAELTHPDVTITSPRGSAGRGVRCSLGSWTAIRKRACGSGSSTRCRVAACPCSRAG
jgi:RNA polymerase sigma-70 factor (ECF subfamily)